MDKQKFEVIVDRLLKHSEEDKLDWKTTASDGTYLLALNESSIIVSNIIGRIIFRFNNKMGETVESVQITSEAENYEKCSKLYELARRKALNSDETIDHILKQLEPDSIAA